MLVSISRISFTVPVSVDSGSGIGILKVRERDGIADLPERSLSRLLAVSHIASLSESLSIQFRGLDIIRVR